MHLGKKNKLKNSKLERNYLYSQKNTYAKYGIEDHRHHDNVALFCKSNSGGSKNNIMKLSAQPFLYELLIHHLLDSHRYSQGYWLNFVKGDPDSLVSECCQSMDDPK